MKTALITGINGQDGYYLSQLLLDKGYTVHGTVRRHSVAAHQSSRIEPFRDRLNLVYSDMTDATSIIRVIQETQPDEIYNLAAQSHVAVSFETPEYTANADALGTLRLLEAIRILKLESKTRFYQASTSELFGNQPAPQSETTPFEPRSPYAAAKCYAYWVVRNYREAYGIHASNGILFNHESPMRGETFVTRKIAKAVARIARGEQECLCLGNLNAKRDWGHARDYVEGMWLMMQQPVADDYVLATGEAYSVREFCEEAFKVAGVDWRVKIDERYYRPLEVNHLCGDATKARQKLGWKPKTTFVELVREMVEAEMECAV